MGKKIQKRRKSIVIDTETTGLSPRYGHRIVELGCVEILDGTELGQRFHSYINPERRVPRAASNVHGLTAKFLKDKPTFSQIAPNFLSFIEGADAIWMHNAKFDGGFIRAELEQSGHLLDLNFECSLNLSKRLDLGLPNNKLKTLAAEAGYQWSGRGHHSADEDAHATGFVLINLLWPAEKKLAEKVAQSGGAVFEPASRTNGLAHLPAGFIMIMSAFDERIASAGEFETDLPMHGKGKPWYQEEDQALVDAFLAGEDMEALVRTHGRTPRALVMRLQKNGVISDDHPFNQRSGQNSGPSF